MFENKIMAIQKYCHLLHHKKEKSIVDICVYKTLKLLYSSYLSVFYNSYIPPGAKLGSGIKFNHSFHNIFISEHCTIGNCCVILQNTTIGSNQPIDDSAPIIGDNVYIGANCNIIGNVIVEDDCIIGAGTTIAKGYILKGSKVVGASYRVL